jgi:SAM-dependent methyltransferase
MTRMTLAAAPEVVADELALLGSLAPLAGARVAELGCGSGGFARKLLAAGAARVDAFEVDRIQHERCRAAPAVPGLAFHFGGAEDIALADASRDLVVMMKSLHHVPLEALDRALGEIRRVLVPGGLLYVSEPVYDGEFNDIVKLFHDEGAVRAAAQSALRRGLAAGAFELAAGREFMAPLAFRDYDDFVERIVRATHSEHVLTEALAATVRTRFEAHLGPAGAQFIRPMRVHLLRKPA